MTQELIIWCSNAASIYGLESVLPAADAGLYHYWKPLAISRTSEEMASPVHCKGETPEGKRFL